MEAKGTSGVSSGSWEEEVRRVVATLSDSMYELAASPVANLRAMAASPSASMSDLASMSRDLDRLSVSASLAASMANMMANFVAGMERIRRGKRA